MLSKDQVNVDLGVIRMPDFFLFFLEGSGICPMGVIEKKNVVV
jgi:hypothetical protein